MDSNEELSCYEKNLNRWMLNLQQLHQHVGATQTIPPDIQHRQSIAMKEGLFNAMMEQVTTENCSLRTVELALFHFWLKLFIKRTGLNIENLDLGLQQTLAEAIRLIRKITNELPKDKRVVAGNGDLDHSVEQLKSLFTGKALIEKTPDQISKETENVNTQFSILVRFVLDERVSLDIAQHWFFYYWLRTSTIVGNADEVLFRTIEKNWSSIKYEFEEKYLGFLGSASNQPRRDK